MAPNLPATAVAEAVGDGWRQVSAQSTVQALPMSDGGPGLLEAIHHAHGGELMPVTVTQPFGAGLATEAGVPQQLPASILLLPGHHGGTAVISGDQVIGEAVVEARAASRAAQVGSSRGLGRLLASALDTGASRIVIGLGAAASHDAGFGMAAELLIHREVTSAVPESFHGGNDGLRGLVAHELTGLLQLRHQLADRDIVVAAATDRPLFGLSGSGAALAQRQGISAHRAQELDQVLNQACALLDVHLPQPTATLSQLAAHHPTPRGSGRHAGSGAGGGAAVMLTTLGARLLPGAQVAATMVELPAHLSRCDVVITTCDTLDPLTLHDSTVAAVASAAAQAAVPVVVLAKVVLASRREMAAAGVVAAYETGELPPQPLPVLQQWGSRLARTWGRTA